MLALASIAVRLIQFAAAMVLCGTPLFLLYGLPAQGPDAAMNLAWPRRLIIGSAALLLPAAMAALFVQTAVMAGSFSEALDPASLQMVLTGMHLGWALASRVVLAAGVLVVMVLIKAPTLRWALVSVLGAGIVASFAWSGHGAAGEGISGLVHVLSDLLHLLAAAVWIGALVALTFLLLSQPRPRDDQGRLGVLHRALERFSGVGSAVVAILVASGLVNSWFLIGPDHILGLVTTPYGLVLSAKLLLFVAMLGLAAANRLRLTPALRRSLSAPGAMATAALRRSVLTETAAAFGVLILVSVLGTLAPVSGP